MSAAGTTDLDRRRRRILAAGGLWLLLTGMLTAMSLLPLALALSALGLVAWFASIRVRRVREDGISSGIWALQRSAATAFAAMKRRVTQRFAAAKAGRDDRDQRAARLNELGVRLRRAGEAEQAAARHRAALAIVRDLGDRPAEALTLNNLALALARSGSEEAAVDHLEAALDILRELGNDEDEARVIVNLGLVERRRGHPEQAVVLLHEALGKLPPESPAYRRVEDALARAG